MNAKQKTNIRRKWKRWLERIGDDVGWLLTSHDIFEKIQRILKSNKNIQTPALLHRWIVDNYAARVSIGIRRLSDHDKRAISLYRLIKEISENPDALTRDWFVSQYQKMMRQMRLADRDFDIFANKGGKTVSKFKLKRDMKRLEKDTNRIRKFANKWIAHCDINRTSLQVPTYKDVNRALSDVDTLFCKYWLLLTRGGMSTRKPVLQYDWKEPLRHPWIEMKETEKEWRLRNRKIVWDKRI